MNKTLSFSEVLIRQSGRNMLMKSIKNRRYMNANNKIRSILIIKLLMLSLCTFAQIKGIVREKDSNLPMEFVNVTLLSVSDSAFITGTTTDSLGMFIIPNTITNGIIKVSYIGCNTQFRQIVPKDTLYNFFLQPNESLLKEVVVKGRTYLHTAKGIIANPSLTGIIIFHKFSVCFEGFRFAKYLIISRSVF